MYVCLTGLEPFSTITNPSRQLLCIRRGFWESGLNPLACHGHINPLPLNSLGNVDAATNYSQTTPLSPPSTVVSKPFSTVPTTVVSQPLTTTQSISNQSHQLMLKFLNGDRLWSDAVGREGAVYIYSLLRACLSLSPMERPTADVLLQHLERIDDLLMLGGGEMI